MSLDRMKNVYGIEHKQQRGSIHDGIRYSLKKGETENEIYLSVVSSSRRLYIPYQYIILLGFACNAGCEIERLMNFRSCCDVSFRKNSMKWISEKSHSDLGP